MRGDDTRSWCGSREKGGPTQESREGGIGSFDVDRDQGRHGRWLLTRGRELGFEEYIYIES